MENIEVYNRKSGKAAYVVFGAGDKGEWIRVKADKNTWATASFSYTTPDGRPTEPDDMYKGLVVAAENNMIGGLLYGLGGNRRALGLLANTVMNGKEVEIGYYEMGDKLELIRKKDPATADFIRTKFAIPQQVVSIENSSVLVVDDLGRRWRLPLGDEGLYIADWSG